MIEAPFEVSRPATEGADRRLFGRALSELQIIDPGFTINGFLASEHYKDRSLRQQLQADLKKAGLTV